MHTWKALLLVYRELDVRVRISRWRRLRYGHSASAVAIADGVESCRAFPLLVEDLTSGAATVAPEVVYVDEPLRSITCGEAHGCWPSPSDTREQLDRFAPAGRYNSIFI